MISQTDIIGHGEQRDALLNDLKTGNVAHAYLFAGPRHLGKFTIAKWFASELLQSDVSDPAEKEKVAQQAEKLLHPDLLVIDQLWIEDVNEDADVIARSSNVSQQHRKKAGARTDTVSIDDIRVLQERLYDVSKKGHRCCLIRSMERMQDEAVNSLLKILEEPPPGMVFLLTTQTLTSLLPTIISRCRVLRFSPVPRKELSPLLQGLDEEEAHFLLHVAQGAPGVIQHLKNAPDLLRAERALHSNALAFWQTASVGQRLELLSPLHERGEEAEKFLLHLALALREQSPAALTGAFPAFQTLVRGLKTNAQRQLLAQRFALEVSGPA